MSNEIINRVASSPILTLNLEDMYLEGERLVLDIKDQLFQGLILREKDFRAFIKTHDWSLYQNKFVAVTCSVDAIIPTWAFMLVAQKLEPVAKAFVFGDLKALENYLFQQQLNTLDIAAYIDKPVVIKGCFDKPVPVSAYMEITRILAPHVKSLMYGEPCSTVPIFKKKV
ncbi:MAG TPA: hypothetical protein DIW47_11670 [Bacteroidetes bacterium]|nr:hypothetical protein [Bacteroidota bacterium]